ANQEESRRSCSLSVPENDTEQAPDSLVAVFFLIAALVRRVRRLIARERVVVTPQRTQLAAAGMQRAQDSRFGPRDEYLALGLQIGRASCRERVSWCEVA